MPTTYYDDCTAGEWTVYDTRRTASETVLLIGPAEDFPHATWGVVRQQADCRDIVDFMNQQTARKVFACPREFTIDDLVV